MVKCGPRVAPANVFLLSHNEAYAGTSMPECEAFVFYLGFLEPVELEADDEECGIAAAIVFLLSHNTNILMPLKARSGVGSRRGSCGGAFGMRGKKIVNPKALADPCRRRQDQELNREQPLIQ